MNRLWQIHHFSHCQAKSKKFRQLLVSWIKASGFSRIIVLSSSHAYQRDDQQLQRYWPSSLYFFDVLFSFHSYWHIFVFGSTPIRYLITPSLMKASGDALKELGWRELEKVAAFPGLMDTSAEPRLYIPGGGITKGLYTDGYMHCVRGTHLFFKFLPWPVGKHSCFWCFLQLCGGPPAGCAAPLLFRGRQHPWRVNACEPAQRLAPPAGQSCEWQTGVPCLQRHRKCIRTIPGIVGQFSENHISIAPPFPVAGLPPISEIFLVPFKYDTFQKMVPFIPSYQILPLDTRFRVCRVESPLNKTQNKSCFWQKTSYVHYFLCKDFFLYDGCFHNFKFIWLLIYLKRHVLNPALSRFHFRAQVATSGRSQLPGVSCSAVESLQRSSDHYDNQE